MPRPKWLPTWLDPEEIARARAAADAVFHGVAHNIEQVAESEDVKLGTLEAHVIAYHLIQGEMYDHIDWLLDDDLPKPLDWSHQR